MASNPKLNIQAILWCASVAFNLSAHRLFYVTLDDIRRLTPFEGKLVPSMLTLSHY